MSGSLLACKRNNFFIIYNIYAYRVQILDVLAFIALLTDVMLIYLVGIVTKYSSWFRFRISVP